MAIDAHGRPALLRHTVGAGEAVLATYPLEYMASARAHVNPEPTWRLYDALARVAGVHRDLVVDDPLVFTDTLVHADGRRFGWLVSQHPEEVTVTPQQPAGLGPVTLAPYGVQVVALDGGESLDDKEATGE